ncbi:LHFPL tetraspan subfamily member 2 protein [Aplysia californica]|uniref:LHFPL tetraspan subfamily member 2 protein n=1 Tax=Aplysia californica TaxID=6500 RepID=A0ABM0ZVG2_APLCA|nr:LHFPL tetraspan subfamily member 2 protein [Aplysia californica]
MDQSSSSNGGGGGGGDGSGSADISKIPSGAWQAACLLFGAGVCVQILGAGVSLVVLGLREPWHHRVALLNGYMQTLGVLLLLSGLILYPIGFSSPFFSYYCDSSKAFCTGHCAMGWSYVTAVMAAALSIFCPVMSNFAEAQQRNRKPGHAPTGLTLS